MLYFTVGYLDSTIPELTRLFKLKESVTNSIKIKKD